MIKIYAISKTRQLQGASDGRWFELPESVDKISADLQLVDEHDLLILGCEAPFKLDIELPIETLNDIARRFRELPQHLLDDMNELIGEGYESVEEILAFPYKFTFVGDVSTDQQLGHYLVTEDRWHTIPNALKYFIDERLYGQDFRHLSGAFYTKSGVYIK